MLLNQHHYLGLQVSNVVTEQFVPPNEPYALIDHFPDTIREIPVKVLESISARCLELIYNPRDIPYERLISLIQNATELHLTNSSLLCLCLLIGSRAESKNIYLIKLGLYHGHNSYDASWREWALSDGNGHRFPQPVLVNRAEAFQKDAQTFSRSRKRFIYHVFFSYKK
jgi:hypothetical protein